MSKDVSKNIERGGILVNRSESTYGLPRFLGVPKDNQLLESSSLEGILNGRRISEVVTSDTKELEKAGIGWERAVHVLKCLAISSSCQTENFSPEGIQPIIGFNSVYSERTRARFQFDDPISGTRSSGDQTPFDSVATIAPECQIRYSGDRTDSFITVINQQTLLMAEYYHLLEKGNQYAMTGDQLGKLVNSFNEKEFNERLGPWLTDKMRKEMYGLAVPRGHIEAITFGREDPIRLKIGYFGSITITFFDKSPIYLGINHNSGRLKGFELQGKLSYAEMKRKNSKFILTFRSAHGTPGFSEDEEIIDSGSSIHSICEAGATLLKAARNQPDKILSDNSRLMFDLAREVQRV